MNHTTESLVKPNPYYSEELELPPVGMVEV